VPTTVAAAGSLLSKFMIIALPSILRATAQKKKLNSGGLNSPWLSRKKICG